MSAAATAWARAAIEKTRLSPSAERVLLAIARAHTDKHGCATLAYNDLSDRTRDCRRAVINAVSSLVSCGFVRIEKRYCSRGKQAANSYFLPLLLSADMHPVTECICEHSVLVNTVHSVSRQLSADMHPPTRARTRVRRKDPSKDRPSETDSVSGSGEGLTLEEMEARVWPKLRVVSSNE